MLVDSKIRLIWHHWHCIRMMHDHVHGRALSVVRRCCACITEKVSLFVNFYLDTVIHAHFYIFDIIWWRNIKWFFSYMRMIHFVDSHSTSITLPLVPSTYHLIRWSWSNCYGCKYDYLHKRPVMWTNHHRALCNSRLEQPYSAPQYMVHSRHICTHLVHSPHTGSDTAPSTLCHLDKDLRCVSRQPTHSTARQQRRTVSISLLE